MSAPPAVRSSSDTVRQNSSCGLGSPFLRRSRENRPPAGVGTADDAMPTDISTICHRRRPGRPTMNSSTVTSPATTIWVSIDNVPPAEKMARSSSACTPANTDSTSRLNATVPTTLPTRRRTSWCTMAISPTSGAVRVNNRTRICASSTAAFANSWNSA